jgi:predicted ATPase
MSVYRVLGESGARSRLDVVTPRGLTPLVGREREVEVLVERWEQVRQGQGQVVLLCGEAGIGKSRLVRVLRDHLAGAAHTRLECHSSPYYQHTALYPMTEWLHCTLAWQHDDPPHEKWRILAAALSPYPLVLAEAVPLFAALLSLPLPENAYPPLTLSPQQQRHQTLRALRTLLLAKTVQQPVLFILEDLHWTDPSTLELLSLLIEHTPTAALYMVLTCRPEFQPPWGSGRP